MTSQARTAEDSRQEALHTLRRRVVVFGGAGGMGMWIARFLGRSGHDITIADINPKTPGIAATEGFRGVVLEGDDLAPVLSEDGHCDCDVAVIAVPMGITLDVIGLVGPRLKTGSLLMDITSRKESVMLAMDQAAPPGVAVLGTHPLFGPRTPSFVGETCVIIPSQTRPPGIWLDWWLDMLAQEDALQVESTAAEHDRMMQVVQVLLHYSIICFSKAFIETLSALDIDPNLLHKFKTPTYEAMMGLVAVICDSSDQLYHGIQQHPDGKAVRSRYLDCCRTVSAVFQEDTPAEYTSLRLAIREAIGPTNKSAFSFVAGTIFNNMTHQRQALLTAAGKMKMACVENTASKRTHHGRVLEVSPNGVEMDTLTKKPRIITISLKNARLLAPEETNAWRVSNLPLERKTLPFRSAGKVYPQAFADLAAGYDGVAKVAVTDTYRNPETPGETKITLSISVVADEEGKAAYKEISKLFEGLGCILL